MKKKLGRFKLVDEPRVIIEGVTVRFICLLFIGALVGGCGTVDDFTPLDVSFDDDFFVDTQYEQSALTITHSEAHGDLGGVLIDGLADEVFAVEEKWNGGASAHVTSYFNPSPGVWAMTRIELYGGIDHPDVRAGAVLSNDGVTWGYDPNALYISAVGCSGEAKNVWDWDSPTSDVEVQIELSDVNPAGTNLPSGPGGALNLDYTVNFRSYNGPATVLTGSVTIEQ